jgi:type VI secretion system protein VasJ
MDLQQLGKQPISPENPAGIDTSDELAEFDNLEDEIRKLSVPSVAGGGVDWDRVVEFSEFILAEKFKSLRVAVYLAVALARTRGLEGLSSGLMILKDLTDNFWDSFYPSKPRGRRGALEWWFERTESFLAAGSETPVPEELVNTTLGQLEELGRLLSEKIEDAPDISRLGSYLRSWPTQAAAVADPAPAQTPAPPAPDTPKPPAAPLSTGDIDTPQDAERALETNLRQLVLVSDQLLRQDPSNPLAYHLIRIGSWLTVGLPPPTTSGNQTALPPPDAMVRSGIERLLTGHDYEAAIGQAEERVGEFLFWLDLSRFTFQALEQLGGRYQMAMEAVAGQTVLYFGRLSGLENLAFSDGTPFADPETRAWLNSITAQEAAASPILAANGDGSGIEAEVAEVFLEAQGLIKDKQLSEAVMLLHHHLARGGSGQERFTWRIALAQLLLGAGQIDLARPHLEQLLSQVEEYQLEQWDPRLALQALMLVHQGLSGDARPEAQEKGAGAFDRIVQINPAAALQIKSKS